MSLSTHCHGALLHRLQQGSLGFRRGPVDLIGQQDVAERRSGPKLELALVAVPNAHAGDVGWEKVGSELDPADLAVNAAGQSLGQAGLAHTGDVFNQNVAPSDERQGQEMNLGLLAPNRVVDIGSDGVERFREAGDLGGAIVLGLRG